MLVKAPLSNQRIIDCLNTYYGIEVCTLTFLPLGADINGNYSRG
jgi:spectinomycin phosphotransferase